MKTNAALALTVAFAAAALVAAALHANPSVLGWLGALSFFAFAAATGIAARDLNAPSDLREPREPRGPSHPKPLPEDALSRSGVFGRMWGVALGAFAILGLAPFVALARYDARRGTAWRAGARLVTADNVPIKADTLEIGAVETVFPENAVDAPEAATLLLRLDDGILRTGPEREGWAPQGNVAYSKICTHAGCPVAIYRQTSYQLYCPCHQSVFDVLHGARPVSGPATRALPQLALDVDARGYLIARGDYTEPVGPDEWDRPV